MKKAHRNNRGDGMTRIDDVAKKLKDAYQWHGEDFRAIARALHTDGHLLPDLPEVSFAQDGTPYWEADGEVYQPSQKPGFIDGMDPYGETFCDSVEAIRDRALAMLAAADWAERNQ